MSVFLFVVFRRFPSLPAGGERPFFFFFGGGVAHSSPLLPFPLLLRRRSSKCGF